MFWMILIMHILSSGIAVTGFGAEFLCARIPGFTSKQREICKSAPDSLAAIGQGTRLGLSECQYQFRNTRWNCTVLDAAVGHIVITGSREAAYLYAISSAGVTYTIAQECSRGNITTCGCSPPTTISTSTGHRAPPTTAPNEWSTMSGWKWGGCSTDIIFANRLSRIFLDSREVEGDARSFMNLHNNKAGRKAVQNTLETQCKCHGMSGSCTLKTCWLKLASFGAIGDQLMKKYAKAMQVIAVKSGYNDSNGDGRRSPRAHLFIKPNSLKPVKNVNKLRNKFRAGQKSQRNSRTLQPKLSALVYLEQSPNYCEVDALKGILGTKGRECARAFNFSNTTSTSTIVNSYALGRINRNHKSSGVGISGQLGLCELLCCGRGYSTHQILKKWKCACKFTWCCTVECSECEQLVEIYTCN